MARDRLREWSFHRSGVRAWVLNRYLQWRIPFNFPHRLAVQKLSDNEVAVKIPFIRRNQNHLRGLHACVLAAGAEFASGVLLLRHVDGAKTRLIMKNLQVGYHYRAQEESVAVSSIDAATIARIAAELESEEAVLVNMKAELHDRSGNHLATAQVEWQLKPWRKVSVK